MRVPALNAADARHGINPYFFQRLAAAFAAIWLRRSGVIFAARAAPPAAARAARTRFGIFSPVTAFEDGAGGGEGFVCYHLFRLLLAGRFAHGEEFNIDGPAIRHDSATMLQLTVRT